MNGNVSFSTSAIDERYSVGTTASFMCSDGYRRYGSGSISCQTTGEWTRELPTCGGKKNMKKTNIFLLLCVWFYLFSLNGKEISLNSLN